MSRFSEDELQALATYWAPRDAAKPEDPQKSSNTRYIYVGSQLAGVRVTMESAFQVGAIWGCIDAIAKPVASSDWLVFQWVSARKRRELPEDRLSYLLNVRPNPEMTAQSFRRALMIAALSWGNGYAEIVRDMSGRVAALWPISPERVTPQRIDGQLGYLVKNDDTTEVWLRQEDMFHIRGPSISGLVGDNVIGKAAGAIALSMATQKFAEAYFGNGTQLGTILEYPGEIDDPTFERLTRQWNGKHQGPGKAFRTAFIDAGMKVVDVGKDSSAEKAQLVTARQQDIEDICRWWGVPPHKVQHLLRSTNNNIEHQGLEFTRDALRPWARELQQEADFKLFSDRGPRRFTLLDLDWASEGDFKSRMEGLQIGRNMGVLNGNEIRSEIGWDDMGPDGDKYIVQGAMTELKNVGKVYEAPGGKAAAPAEPKEDDAGEKAVQAWVAEIYARAGRRRQNRESDLADKGRTDAAASAMRDAKAYLAQQLRVVEPHVTACFGGQRRVEDALERHGLTVLDGADAQKAAADLFNELEC